MTIDDTQISFVTEDRHSRWFFHHRYRPGEPHEPAVSLQLAACAKTARVFADVGAHIGYHACIAGALNKALKLFIFEMNRNLVPTIARNLRENGIRNAEIVNQPVSDDEGDVVYQRDSTSPGLLMQKPNEVGDPERPVVTAKTVSLDRYFKQFGVAPDLIKIDVQGAETNVLRGAHRIIETARPTLFVEVHPALMVKFGATVEELYSLLRDHNYRLFRFEAHRRDNAHLSEVTWIEDFASETHMLLCEPNCSGGQLAKF